MTPLTRPGTSPVAPVCPLCHTRDVQITAESLAAGDTWVCTTCGQRWSAARLETVAAYAEYTAAH